MADDTNKDPVDDTVEDPKLGTAAENDLWSSRRKMAWVSLWGIIVPTSYIILRISDVHVLTVLGDLMSWYYLALASIVGAYCGFKSWAQIKGRDKSDG